MSCIGSLQNSIDFIENNLKNDIRLEDCAIHAAYSPFHYSRIFQMIAQITVMDYVRTRRLSKAAVDIFNSTRPIKDIAFE